MIGIEINGNFFELPDDVSIRFELNNPIFNNEAIQESYTFPFNLPVTPAIQSILEAANLIPTVNKNRSVLCTLFYQGAVWKSGLFKVIRTTNMRYSCNVIIGGSALAVFEKKLSEIDLGGVRVLGEDTDDVIAHANSVVVQKYPAVDYNFPVISNPDFYGNTNLDFQGKVNRWDAPEDTFPKNQVGEESTPINQDCLSPQVYLMYILKRGFLEHDYALKGDFVDDEEAQEIVIYNNVAIDEIADPNKARVSVSEDYTVSTYTPSTIEFDDDTTPPNEDAENKYDTSTFKYTIPAAGTYELELNFDIHDIDPPAFGPAQIAVLVILDGASVTGELVTLNVPDHSYSHTFTYFFSAADIGKEVHISIVFTSTDFGSTGTMKAGSYWRIENMSTGGLNKYATSINLQNHVPDITFAELLNAFKIPFCFGIFFDDERRICYLNYVKNVIRDTTYIDMTGKVTPDYEINIQERGFTFKYDFPSDDELVEDNFKSTNTLTFKDEYASRIDLPPGDISENDYALVTNLNAFYIVNADLLWERYSDNYEPVVVGSGEEEISPKATPMFMSLFTVIGATVLGPSIRHNGTSDAFGLDNRGYSLRFGFYKGMQLTSDGESTYPMATTQNQDYFGNEIGNYTLKWDGENGLFNTFWRPWTDKLAPGEYVTRYVKLNFNDVKSFNHLKKIFIDYQLYLGKTASIVLKNNSIELARIESLKL